MPRADSNLPPAMTGKGHRAAARRAAGPARLEALGAGLWAGLLLAVALIATPAPFATLSTADAGRVVARVLAEEAYASLAAGVLLVVLAMRRERTSADDERAPVSAELLLLFGTLACTIAGYFVIQPLLPAARAGQGALSFGALHALSVGCFALKVGLVLALAWRLGRPPRSAAAAAAASVRPPGPTS